MVIIEDPRYGDVHTLHDQCYPYAAEKLTEHGDVDRDADDGSPCLWCGESIEREAVSL